MIAITRLKRLIVSAFVIFVSLVAMPATGAEDFLPPEQAFRFEARALDARNVEIVFTVANGYYLYREQFAFAAEGVVIFI